MYFNARKYFLILFIFIGFYSNVSLFSDEILEFGDIRIGEKEYCILSIEKRVYKNEITIKDKIDTLIMKDEYIPFIYANNDLFYFSGYYYINSYVKPSYVKFILKKIPEDKYYDMELPDEIFTNLDMTGEEIEYFKNNNNYENNGIDEYGEYMITREIFFANGKELLSSFHFFYIQLTAFMYETVKQKYIN
jgi:hypothetical protein